VCAAADELAETWLRSVDHQATLFRSQWLCSDTQNTKYTWEIYEKELCQRQMLCILLSV